MSLLSHPVPGQAYCNAHVKLFGKFLDFFETQCWQPWLLVVDNSQQPDKCQDFTYSR